MYFPSIGERNGMADDRCKCSANGAGGAEKLLREASHGDGVVFFQRVAVRLCFRMQSRRLQQRFVLVRWKTSELMPCVFLEAFFSVVLLVRRLAFTECPMLGSSSQITPNVESDWPLK
ncbi:hypothetical protein PPTG_18379 [Phytophthora nicotianae INRA-310]|uniref:Uncharacterized protein n=1 Tax=Phytophthora nicotianae (strain INRA-310) TaxID=761204 RepID=W2PGI8_PHYN3|nr:hypothetical protein PPTG_18379 [Phytophthora nicotianae INRA-310]ETM99996.1 hypothetical protein PPTG_18379 [Phytophthora nicotianae INRA-310]